MLDRPFRIRLGRLILGLPLALIATVASGEDGDELPPAATRPVDFAKDIRPILAKNCVRCHGAEKQKGGLSLHSKAKAFAGGDDGPAFEAGKSAESRLIRFVAGIDDDGIMPPEGSGDALSPEQVGLLRAWIDQGAAWPDDSNAPTTVKSNHWSFRAPERPDFPQVKHADWSKNAIDRFILARLEKEGLTPSPEADRTTLIRRLSLDLIGLPPTPSEVDTFLADTRPDAYERLVDRLLASPHFGERWGRRWLDRARYADTNGYEKDRERSIWPYRDWVIDAINTDKPFDRFTTEQIAGDLLPNASLSTNIATGFHRNTMTNEEGGIDIEEFRFASLVDRVATTGTVWLGLTVQCAQCHTHKFDPITQREYYQFLAFFNNADEPEIDVPSPEIAARRAEAEAKLAAKVADLENRFPAEDESAGWEALKPLTVESASGAALQVREDGSVLASGMLPESDVYRVVIETDLPDVRALRIEALTDPSLPSTGPGRTPHGNFVLTEFHATAAPVDDASRAKPLTLGIPSADFSQQGFEVRAANDGQRRTGWAIDDLSGHLNKARTATFPVLDWSRVGGKTRLTLTLEQTYGGQHVLGRFRIAAKRPVPWEAGPNATVEERRHKHFEAKFAAWKHAQAPVAWTALRPEKVTSKKLATLTVQDDLSVLATGDKPNNDVYELDLETDLKGITALRLEVLPDPSMPDGGPGRAPLFSVGDFILTEVDLSAQPKDDKAEPRRIALKDASEDYAEPDHPAALSIDGQHDTGWSIRGRTGQAHAAVFNLAEPVGDGRGTRLHLTLFQEGIHQMTIGRFRISATTETRPVRASGLPADVEALFLKPDGQRAADEDARIRRHYLTVAPELSKANAEIETLRKALPKHPTTLAIRERTPELSRTTQIRKRGEFLSPTVTVQADVPAVLPPLPSTAPKDRLALANWLVSEKNPLVGRVAVNQVWQAYFGRGLVATVEDFGTRGERPSHPELLDWLATELPRQGWSMKALHRRIVTSATYRQSSTVSPELLARDPKNELLARGPRFRVEAEVVRDIALAAGGLLSTKIGGPSVFPPQPDGITSLAYGQTPWTASTGADRYRRGVYTFLKRTAPFAAFATLDAPTSETTCVRRERSNTPLQALTLLNDPVFVEAARALARRVLDEAPADAEGRARLAFRLALTRQPSPEELAGLTRFQQRQLDRFRSGGANAGQVAGMTDAEGKKAGVDLPVLAAWTSVARALLNLDETITKE